MTATKAAPAALPADFAREILKLDNQLCFALYSASGMMTRAYREILEPLGLTYPQYLVMLALWETAPRTVKDVGAAVGLDSGTMTPLLKRLEATGFITRQRDPADERRVVVGLSERGDALRQQAVHAPMAIFAKLKTPIGEVAALTRALKSLTTNMAADRSGQD